MKVLVISHMYPSTFNQVAGIFVHQQVKLLVRNGVEIKVISPIPWAPLPLPHLSNKWRGYFKIPVVSHVDGIDAYYPRYIAFPRAVFLASSGQRMYFGIRKLVAQIREGWPFDLIHAHVAVPDGYAASKLASKFNVPFVVTIHGQDLQQTIYKNGACLRAVERAMKFASCVLLVSRKLRKISIENFGESNKLMVVPNGVDLETVYSGQSVFSHKYRDKRILLSAGNLVAAKGTSYTLRAVARLLPQHRQVHLLIIGSGPEREKLERLTKELAIQDHVDFLGLQSHDMVMKYMSFCECFVLPSWNEAFGVVYLEAMAHGKPVIGCKGQGIEDFVENGKTGILVDPRSVDSLVQGLEVLLSNPEKARAMGERAKRLVIEKFTWQQNVARTLGIYKQVLEGGGR